MSYGLTQSIDLEASSNQSASITDASQTGLDITSDMTTEGWVKFESLPGDGVQYTFQAKWNNTGNQRGPIFYFVNTAGVYTLNWGSSEAGTTFSAASVTWTPSTGVWYHVAQTWQNSSNELKFYVDGVQQGSTQTVSLTGQFDNTAPFELGNVKSLGPFDGKMSLWRVWDTVRSVTDIANNICNVLGSTTNLKGEWTFDNVYTDNSGNGNTLTGVNSPTFTTDVPSTCSVSTTIKTYSGTATANVKTVLNGTAIANRKTWNGIT